MSYHSNNPPPTTPPTTPTKLPLTNTRPTTVQAQRVINKDLVKQRLVPGQVVDQERAGATLGVMVIDKEKMHQMPDGTMMLGATHRFQQQLVVPEPEGVASTIGLIQGITIDTSEMPTAATTRSFYVNGTLGSKFIVQVIQDGTLKYYDFILKSFTLGHISNNNNLKITLTNNNTYHDTIDFPSGGGTYVIKVIPEHGTEFRAGYGGIGTTTIKKQASNSTITFKAFTANTNSYATFPTSTSTGGSGDVEKIEFNWDITNASTDANGFGLIPTSSFKDLNLINDLWFFSTTETVDGAVAPTDTNGGFVVKVDDLTDIGLGSYISAISSGTLVGKPIVININTDTKELTINIAQTFANDITLTFRADGVLNINKAIGVNMEFAFSKTDEEKFLETNRLVKTVRAGSSGTTINLNGTYGVGHNDTFALISGVGITSASVVSVSASSSAGSMVVSVSQGTLTVGTRIFFNNIVQVFNVFGSIKVNKYPSAAKTIYLDIDKFLTPGTAS